jgi:LacI family transcriptional regulator
VETFVKCTGVKDIARALGISTGTVDRALHAKPGVNPTTRDLVLSTAEALGYRPNLAARFLKPQNQLRIAVYLPQPASLFWDLLRGGISEAAASVAPALRVEFRTYRNPNIPFTEETIREGTDGLIIGPGNLEAVRLQHQLAARRHIPAVCVAGDAPDEERLTSVFDDPFTGGGMAGELLARFIPKGGHVAFFTNTLSVREHAARLQGFEAALRSSGSALRLGPVVELREGARQAYRRTTAVLWAHRALKALYISTAEPSPVVEAADRAGRLRRLKIMTTGLFPESVDWIRNRKVIATVDQRPICQGRLATKALYAFLLEGTRPPPRLRLPHLVMRSNLELFLDRFGVTGNV